jgi:hypothetical protein
LCVFGVGLSLLGKKSVWSFFFIAERCFAFKVRLWFCFCECCVWNEDDFTDLCLIGLLLEDEDCEGGNITWVGTVEEAFQSRESTLLLSTSYLILAWMGKGGGIQIRCCNRAIRYNTIYHVSPMLALLDMRPVTCTRFSMMRQNSSIPI